MSWYKKFVTLSDALFELDLKNRNGNLAAEERLAYKALKHDLYGHWAHATDADLQEALRQPPIPNFTEHWTLEHLQQTRARYLAEFFPNSQKIC